MEIYFICGGIVYGVCNVEVDGKIMDYGYFDIMFRGY